MRVGIIDYDFWQHPKTSILNVEAMKLGTYYEERECQVDVLSPEDNIFLFDKIIFIFNGVYLKNDMKHIYQHPNVSFLGSHFNNDNYVSFDNKEIDYAKPQNKFYNNCLKYYFKNKTLTDTQIKDLLSKTFVRIFPNQKPIDIDRVMTGEKMYVVDSDIFRQNNWEETIKYLAVFNRYFYFCNPIIVRNIDDLKNFQKLLDYHFLHLKAEIRVEKLNDFITLIQEGKEIINQYSSLKFIWRIGYKEDNNYTEDFYAQEFYNTLLRIKMLNENQIEVRECYYTNHSQFEFTSVIFEMMQVWGRTRECTVNSFNEYIFNKVKNKKIKDSYLRYLWKHPEYEPLINKIYKKGGK